MPSRVLSGVLLLAQGVAALRLTPSVIGGPLLTPPHLRRVPKHCRANAKRDAAGFLAPEELGDWVNLEKSNDLGASTLKKLPERATELVERLKKNPKAGVEFEEVMEMIDSEFETTQVSFSVGDTENESGSNMGSAKILSLGKLFGLTEEETLGLFGRHYRDVLATPDGTDHSNIRSFMASGWAGVKFPWGLSLSPKLAKFDTSTEAVEEALAKSAQISGDDEWDPDSEIWIP